MMLTTHIEPRKDHLLAFFATELDRVRHERLRRDFLDDRVPPLYDLDQARFLHDTGTDPVARKGNSGKAENAVGGGQRSDSCPKGFVMR